MTGLEFHKKYIRNHVNFSSLINVIYSINDDAVEDLKSLNEDEINKLYRTSFEAIKLQLRNHGIIE